MTKNKEREVTTKNMDNDDHNKDNGRDHNMDAITTWTRSHDETTTTTTIDDRRRSTERM